MRFAILTANSSYWIGADGLCHPVPSRPEDLEKLTYGIVDAKYIISYYPDRARRDNWTLWESSTALRYMDVLREQGEKELQELLKATIR